ncbi:SDR family NAD(P)-dependent oxidoreductase [Microbulbifer hainanensis]|uniref:SDR family NAD(P)-dependent oxidoreductase n=1 Tax=Microbulbifer hainanensis TaxID=2735675 RepID=UPI001866F4E9|nr:SDR family NAD(P)-dependent oxidoreductase [Microbulbifer hainanensis]
MSFANPESVLVAGASGGLARALGAELVRRNPQVQLLTVSRGAKEGFVGHSGSHEHLTTALDETASVDAAREFIAAQERLPDWVINCCGLLHTDTHGPEKSLEQCDDDWLLQSMQINVLTHLHLARALSPLLQRRSPMLWVSLSAKVGSIEDNRLGGWYSYRMSKAALNMLVKNLSIEWGRRVPGSCVVAIHPGTTDTELSKPFQANIPADKLYTPAQSAGRIVDVLEKLDAEDSGQLLFWDGSVLPW